MSFDMDNATCADQPMREQETSLINDLVIDFSPFIFFLLLISPTGLIVTGIVSIVTGNSAVFGVASMITAVLLISWLLVLRLANYNQQKLS